MPGRKSSKTGGAAATGPGASTRSKATETAAADLSSTPSWPQFRPQLPVSDLTPDVLVPSKVVLFHNFFPRSLCRDYVSFLKDLPLVTTPGKPKRGEAVRVNDRFQVEDPKFANRLWLETGLKEALSGGDETALWGGQVVGLSPRIRVYRYSANQFFDAHYDESNMLTLASPPDGSGPIAVRTTWTLLLYLTSAAEGCVGGETVFFPFDRRVKAEEIAVAPETGMLLLHKHGDDCMLHEGREVKGGEKWILRTDLCVRR